MPKGSKKKTNAKVKTRKAALKKKKLEGTKKDSFTNKFVSTNKNDTYEPTSTSTNHSSTDAQMSQDPNTYDRPPDTSTNDTCKNNASVDLSTQIIRL